ncbi:MAG: hypothetical protein JO181_08510 [Solirubrobacterales bacterium]|nr:hypothetical protein [Solirubrobacterales bacterium]
MPVRLRRPLLRSLALGNLHEILLGSAIGMILIIRLQLWATHYPKLGGGKLHIAHLLYGGFLMVIAIAALVSFVDRRVRVPAAVIGGAGFGFFIDEIGKFTTSDNDYFFKPAAGMIYVAFLALYFGLRFVRQRREYASAEYVAHAMALYVGGTAGLYESERREALRSLELGADDPRAANLRALIDSAPTVPDRPPSAPARLAAWVRGSYDVAASQRWFRIAIVLLFFCWATLNLGALLGVSAFLIRYTGISGLQPEFFDTWYGNAETISQYISIVLIYAGLYFALRGRYLSGYRALQIAVLVQLFIGQFFSFLDQSFSGVWGLLACLAILVMLRLIIAQEQRRVQDHPAAATDARGPRAGPPSAGDIRYELSAKTAGKLVAVLVGAPCALGALVYVALVNQSISIGTGSFGFHSCFCRS